MTVQDTHGRDRGLSHQRLRRAAAVLSLVALASACSSPTGSGDDVDASPTSPSTAAPDGPTSGARTAYRVPASCGRLALEQGVTLPGATVATCWGDALRAHGSVRAWTNGPPAMEAEVELEPGSRLRTEASDGRVVVLVDGASYGLLDGRWVRGVLNSEVEDEAIVAATGEFAAVTFSPQGLAQGVGECPAWRVAPDRSALALHDGTPASRLVRLDCTAAFDTLGATTTGASLWVQEDWTPVRHAATLSVGGASAESVKDLADHGATFDIPTPTP
ncbi:hypothetical protein LL946_15030 [Knoellia locipacati]|uniref:hypothetical protein n=1 Tax=Knoellia locipacati TaxID=882824 RepID=UPI00384DB50C